MPGNLAWKELSLGACSWQLCLETCSSETCSCEYLGTVLGNLACWKPCLGTCAWEPVLGNLVSELVRGNLAWEFVPGSLENFGHTD